MFTLKRETSGQEKNVLFSLKAETSVEHWNWVEAEGLYEAEY